MPIPVCIHCLKADPLTWRPFHESWCALQSACGWTLPTHESAESGWSTPCLRAISPAAGAPSLYTESRTGWLRILQRRLRAWLSLCTARTYSPHPDAPSHLCRKHLSVLLVAYCAPHQKEAFLSCQRPPSRGGNCCAGQTYHLPYRQKKPNCPSPWSLIQRFGRHFLGHAVMQSQYPITAARKLKVVGDDKGSEPVLSMKSLHQSEYHLRGSVIQITCWLIRHQDFWSCYQGPGQGHPLLLTAGKFSCAMMTAAL